MKKKIGADELILSIRKNGGKSGVYNNIIGRDISKIMKKLGGKIIEKNKQVEWDTRKGAKNVGKTKLPKTAAQYEIDSNKIDDLLKDL